MLKTGSKIKIFYLSLIFMLLPFKPLLEIFIKNSYNLVVLYIAYNRKDGILGQIIFIKNLLCRSFESYPIA